MGCLRLAEELALFDFIRDCDGCFVALLLQGASRWGSATEVAAVDKLSIVFTLILAVFFLHDTFTVKSLIGCALIATRDNYYGVVRYTKCVRKFSVRYF